MNYNNNMSKHLPYTDIWTDSRKVTPRSLFVSLATTPDADRHIKQAIKKGAIEILQVDSSARNNTSSLLAQLLKRQYPLSLKIKIVAITGTDGKSSVVHFCREIAGKCGHISASIGTLGVFVTDTSGTRRLFPGTLTTPDQCTTFQYLYQLEQHGVQFVFIEYSSIGIHQNRLAGIPIYGAVFTTFASDHLDYHGTLIEYRTQKERLFSELVSPRGFALVHEKVSNHHTITHRARRVSIVTTPNILYSSSGLILKDYLATTSLFAGFLAENLYTAVETCKALKIPVQKIKSIIPTITGPAGRFETITAHHKPLVIIDYAHTPAGLEKLLQDIIDLRKQLYKQKIFIVLGAGGDRDSTKRIPFGRIASTYANVIVVTDDNPRTESPALIRKGIMDGITDAYTGIVKNIAGREKAITWAIAHAQPEDIVVLAGKGHEDYQILGKKKYPFSEKNIVKRLLKKYTPGK